MLLRRARESESGIALLTVLLAMALLTVIGAAITSVGIVEFRTSINHRSATRALLLADAGATHALALMRGELSEYTYSDLLLGPDGVADTGDDGELIGYGLGDSDLLPDTGVMLGGGRYFVKLENDTNDPSGDPHSDTNERLVAVCRGETPDGGVAEVRALLAAPTFPAVVVNGDLTLPGNPDVLGPCAGVHTNGRLTVSGTPVVDGEVTWSDTIILGGTIRDAAGDVVVPFWAPPVEVPDYDPLEFCDEADYILHDGWVVTIGPPRDSADAKGGGVLGWKWNSGGNTYSLTGNKAESGTYCVLGNVEVTGNAGSTSDPLVITILATGSVKVTGNPVLEADHPDGILIVAEGDVEVGGTASGITPAYAGLVYAGSQCQMHGTPGVGGHLLCDDAPDPLGATNIVTENKLNGTPTVSYDCAGARRRTLLASWWEARAR
jgi:hypothetical protein